MIISRIGRQRSLLFLALIFALTASGGSASSQATDSPFIARYALSHNGRFVAAKSVIAADDSEANRASIWLYDLQNLLSPPRFLADVHRQTRFMEFSPNDEYLAVGLYSEVRVFSVIDGRELLRQSRFFPMVPILTRAKLVLPSFSPDSQYIQFLNFQNDDERVLEIWELNSGEQIKIVPAGKYRDSSKTLLMSPDWRQGVAAWGDKPIAVQAFSIEYGIGEVLGRLSDEQATVGDAFNDDGSLFAHATWGGGVEVYDTATWSPLNSIQLHDTPCGDLGVSFAFSHTGSRLVSSCQNEDRITVWDYENDAIDFITVTQAIWLQYSSDDTYLIGNPVNYGKNKLGIAVWNTRQDYEISVYPGAAPTVHPHENLMLAIGPGGDIWIWHIELEQLQLILPAPASQAAKWSD